MSFEIVNSKVMKADLSQMGDVLARRGAMLFYTGDISFTPHSMAGGGGGGGIAGRLAGEHEAQMRASGRGEVHYGHAGLHVTVVEVQSHQQMQVEASRLLAHGTNLQAAIVMIGQQGGLKSAIRGAVTGQGLFTSQLSGQGPVALLSHGGTFELPVRPDRPTMVDPQAYVAHLGNVTIELATAIGWRDAVGKGSGEALQLKLTGDGVVYVQASEQKL